MTLAQILRNTSAANPTATAFHSPTQAITWQQLETTSNALAAWLLQQGLQPQDRVAIHWPNSIETIQLLIATIKAGLIAVPVNTRLKAPEIAFVLQHSAARLCFSEPSFGAAAGPNVLQALPTLDAAPATLPETDPNQPAVIVYTSGTTSRPKGATHSQTTLLACTQMLVESVTMQGAEIAMLTPPMMHMSGICALLRAIHIGSTAYILPAFQPAAVLDTIERYRCTFSGGLPAMVHALAEEQARNPRDMSSIRVMLAAGDTVPVALQQRVQSLFGVPIVEFYGMTEAFPIACNPPSAVRAGSFGRAVRGMEIRLIDPSGNNVAPGETGEVIVRSQGICIGYWDDPQATAALIQDGWLHTGDLASLDPDGYYVFRGRLKEIIVRAGSNISPQEVEEALYRHPAVLEAGVIGLPDPVLGQQVAAFIALRPEHQVTTGELIEFTRQHLADYKAPEQIFFIAQLPKGLTGKVHRRSLHAMVPVDPSHSFL